MAVACCPHIVVDWGTTSFRAYKVLGDGTLGDKVERTGRGVLGVKDFEREFTALLPAWPGPVYLVGMAGSSIGWREVPYVATPASPQALASGSQLQVQGRAVHFVPGVSHGATSPDVMRGEETQALGAAALDTSSSDTVLVICPGTHSKWVTVEKKPHLQIVSFATHMTGDVYGALRSGTILTKSVPPSPAAFREAPFARGVSDSRSLGAGHGLLGSLFNVRRMSLSGEHRDAADADNYLSGLLIGAEVHHGAQHAAGLPVVVVGSPALTQRYRAALEGHGITASSAMPEACTVRGVSELLSPAGGARLQAAGHGGVRRAPEFAVPEVVAILRGVRPSEVLGIADALVRAGVTCIEVPLNSPDPFESIARLCRRYAGTEVIIGAGTVLTVEDVRCLHRCGAQLVVSPNTDPEVLAEALRLGLAVMPGVFTASEALLAVKCGATALKLFPAEALSPSGLKALRAVLPQSVRVFAVGGVTHTNLAQWREAGASGFAIGSAFYKPGMTSAEVHERAAAFMASVQAAKL